MKAMFHLAITVSDLKKAISFYCDLLGCLEGRSTNQWIDFDFYGNQLSCHLSTKEPLSTDRGVVDEKEVPIPHFGVILPLLMFETIAGKLRESNFDFILEPQLRFKDTQEEQWTMFFMDPFKNPIEIKSFTNMDKF